MFYQTPTHRDELAETQAATKESLTQNPGREKEPGEPIGIPDLIGKTIGGYKIKRLLGKGGMGAVYEVYDESLDRIAALKILMSPQALDRLTILRFQREAKMAARLHHTNIVPVYGNGFDQGYFYYVMQLIPGIGIDDFLTEARPRLEATLAQKEPLPAENEVVSSSLPPSKPDSPSQEEAEHQRRFRNIYHRFACGGFVDTVEYVPESSRVEDKISLTQWCRSAAAIALQIAQALDYAHRYDVFHRDIKPSNILLDEEGTAWLTDFGLARPSGASNLTSPGEVVGTFRYMAPESFDGYFRQETDLYSLGLTLYEMLVFRPAFLNMPEAKILQKITAGEITPTVKLNPRIPRDLDTIIMKAIGTDPKHRYHTGAEMAEDLRRYLEDRPILARRTSVFHYCLRWFHRNTLLASSLFASAILVCLLAISMTFGFVSERSLRKEREQAVTLASQNLESALSAFNQVFSRFGETNRALHFVGGTGDFFLPFIAEPLDDTDQMVLEDILNFYDQFARTNAANEDLLAETARAYANMGEVHQRTGNSHRAKKEYQSSIEYYRRAIPLSSESYRLELEESQVVCRFCPLMKIPSADDAFFIDVLERGIQRLNEDDFLPNLIAESPNQNERDLTILHHRILAKMRSFRAMLLITTPRPGSFCSPLTYLFTIEGARPDFAPETVRQITDDLAAARLLLEEAYSQASENLYLSAELNLTDAVQGFWMELIDDPEASAVQNRAIERAKELSLEHPDNDILTFHLIEVELLGICAMRYNSNPLDIVDRRDMILQIEKRIETLCSEHPNRPDYQVLLLLTRHGLGQAMLTIEGEEAAKAYFDQVDSGLNQLGAEVEHYPDLQVAEPLLLDTVEWLIDARQYDSAQSRLKHIIDAASADDPFQSRMNELAEQLNALTR